MANWPLWQPFGWLQFGCSCPKRLHSSPDTQELLPVEGTSTLRQNVQGKYTPVFQQRAPDSVFAKAGRRVCYIYLSWSKSNRKHRCGETMATGMDAIAVNLCDLLSSQMRMDGGIPVVPIGRRMRAQPRL